MVKIVTERPCGCRAEIEVDVPASVAYDYYSDRERFPEWMPFISSVKVCIRII